jgi:hypothetical protein
MSRVHTQVHAHAFQATLVMSRVHTQLHARAFQGTLVSIAIGLHNIPEGMAVATVMMAKGGTARGALFWSLLCSMPQVRGRTRNSCVCVCFVCVCVCVCVCVRERERECV